MSNKVGYKETKVGLIPEQWEVKPLKELCDLLNGRAYKKDELLSEGKTPILRVGNFFTNQQWYYSDLELEESKYCDNGDLLYAWSASFGPKIWDGSKVIYHYHIWKLRLAENIDKKFLYYSLLADVNKLKRSLTGSTMVHISKENMEPRLFPVPSLKEQQKIAEILSSVDAAIEKTEQVIAKTGELKKGLMQQLLTKGIGHKEFKQTEIGEIPVEWEISLLGDVVERIVGGGTPSRDIEDYYEGDIPWFTVKDMVGIYLSESQEYITEDAIKNSATNLIEENNVIVATRIGLGKAFINQCDIAINQDLKALFPKKEIISTDYLLLNILGQAEKIIGMGSGTTVKGIRLEQLKKLNILLPPLKEQQRIISIFNQIEQKLGNEKNQYDLLVNLKHGLMQQLLTGQVRVKVD